MEYSKANLATKYIIYIVMSGYSKEDYLNRVSCSLRHCLFVATYNIINKFFNSLVFVLYRLINLWYFANGLHNNLCNFAEKKFRNKKL